MRIVHYSRELFHLLLWRCFVLSLYVIADILLPDHEASGVESLQDTFATTWSRLLLKPFTRWDSVYYITIALHGYQNEYYYVFYPFYPFLLRYLGKAVGLLGSSPLESVIIGGIFYNTICYILNYYLLILILQKLRYSQAIQDTAALLYLYQPATVFSLTIYTEAIYTTFTWLGVYSYLHEHRSIQCIGIGCFGTASLIRSNGMLNMLFLITVSFRRLCATHSNIATMKGGVYIEYMMICLGSLACLIPSYAIQSVLYPLFCPSNTTANPAIPLSFLTHQALCTPPHTPFTFSSSSLLAALWQPSIYSHLQSVYWQIGWFRTYTFRQLPNFLLALPVCFTISYYGLYPSIRSAFFSPQRKDRWNGVMSSTGWSEEREVGGWEKVLRTSQALVDRVIEYVVYKKESIWIAHTSAMLFLVLTLAHVQIATRLFATSPYLYLLVAQLITQEEDNNEAEGDHRQERKKRMVDYLWNGWIGYACVGIVLHANHFPWT
jgi:phosphatidylinositol glycan class V